jgi:FKBP-type peptidyl-prolyl cis-trans isomerase SlyD
VSNPLSNKPEGVPLGPGTVGAIHYVLRSQEGEELQRVEPESPLVFLFGAGALVPGLERALSGLTAGATRRVSVPPEEAFGAIDSSKVHFVPLSAFPDGAPPAPGTMMGAEDESGRPITFWVTAVEEDRAIVNENHPLAGVTLEYEVSVSGVRAATEDEVREGKIAADG